MDPLTQEEQFALREEMERTFHARLETGGFEFGERVGGMSAGQLWTRVAEAITSKNDYAELDTYIAALFDGIKEAARSDDLVRDPERVSQLLDVVLLNGRERFCEMRGIEMDDLVESDDVIESDEGEESKVIDFAEARRRLH